MREPLDVTKKFWYSIAAEYADSGLQIFRHFMNHDESARLHNYFAKLKQQGSIGQFAIIKDDYASPLPDAALLGMVHEDFTKMLWCLSPVVTLNEPS